MHAQRRKWPKRAANRIGDPVRVMIAENHIVRGRTVHGAAPFDARANGGEQAHEPYAQAVAQAIAALAAQLEHEQNRANDAVSAERIASNRAAALQAEIDRLRGRQWWRRVFSG